MIQAQGEERRDIYDGGEGGDIDYGGDTDDFEGWFDDVGNYTGVIDKTGENRPQVLVGAQGNRGFSAFEPAAIEVSRGTTVVWEWTGEGGHPDVSANDGSFQSELTQEAGYTFEHTFDDEGVYKYVCSPHEALGMKGAIVVE